MSNKDYSKREIDNMLARQEDHFEHIKKKLNSIEKQTIKTNGRVDRLEVWRGYITGGLAILGAIVLPLAYIVIEAII